jgi:hypothetical protein
MVGEKIADASFENSPALSQPPPPKFQLASPRRLQLISAPCRAGILWILCVLSRQIVFAFCLFNFELKK